MKPALARQDTFDLSPAVAADETGLPGGALIMTLDGELRVSDLRPGTRVITRDTGMAVLRSIRRRRITGRAVRIKASSLGHNRPERDATLPAGQPVLVRDWRAKALFGAEQALVPAARLVDGEFVTLHEAATMTVYDIEFDTPHVLYVDGLEVASHMAECAVPVTKR
ncbi:Hint domain-containing protein [Roseovarius sp.]|jgi:hypothetical protein|uniref:Hint domain-containing protein n=1 Tax=Roseovarius sp. TaxID=1486281 RepID=UPI002632D2A7|nr:Hint domain-containing protein [Roseovarius sp.]MDM8165315.1 Hint domain-containing protein [Roseovarius sp.]